MFIQDYDYCLFIYYRRVIEKIQREIRKWDIKKGIKRRRRRRIIITSTKKITNKGIKIRE
jgi:hypothetical protein